MISSWRIYFLGANEKAALAQRGGSDIRDEHVPTADVICDLLGLKGFSGCCGWIVLSGQVSGEGGVQSRTVGCRAMGLPRCCLASTHQTTPHLLQSFPSGDELLQIMESFPNKGKEINYQPFLCLVQQSPMVLVKVCGRNRTVGRF